MKHFLILTFIITTSILNAQTLQVEKATSQRINGGAYPRYTINYMVMIKKEKCFNWKIDSVVNIASKKKVEFNIVKVDNLNATSPNYTQVKVYTKNDKGNYQITFASFKSMGSSGRPGAPDQEIIEEPPFDEGAIIYYRNGKKKMKLLITNFEKLETVNAP